MEGAMQTRQWQILLAALIAVGVLGKDVSAENARPLLAQAKQHWLVGTWVWNSEWGPIVMNVTSVAADGQPSGTIENKRFNWHRAIASKASAAEVAAKISGNNMKLFFRAGDDTPNYDLTLSGSSLSGTYYGAGGTRTISRQASFVRR
jgi:hypothetical protein